MRIALFTDTFLPQVNGVVRSVVTTANELVRRGHAVAVFTMDVSRIEGEGPQGELDQRVQVFPFPSFTLPGFRHIQARFPTIARPLAKLRRFRPDVIHLHTIFTVGWEGVACAKVLGCSLVGSHHGFLAEYLSNFRLDYPVIKRLLRRYLAFFYNRCSLVITPARALERELLEHGLRRPVHVLSNPIDLGRFSTTVHKAALRARFGMDRPTAVHLGRLVDQKRVDVVLEGFARLRSGGFDAALMIIGDGRERPRLETLARSLGISDRVVWTGMLHGAPLVERLAACDVFISASTTEVQPLAFLEAMALGLPAIGVRAGGVPELVSDGRSGCLVTPDDPEALAQAMRKLFTDDTLRGALGDGAREVVKSFEAGRVVAELVGVYEEGLYGKAGPFESPCHRSSRWRERRSGQATHP
ncbi:MAG: glycosyltransferase [Gammaproteobacteria bacterium]